MITCWLLEISLRGNVYTIEIHKSGLTFFSEFIYQYTTHYTWYMMSLLIVHISDRLYLRVCVYVEKAMATHCSTPAWKIPWMEEPGRLQSMGSRRVRYDSDSLSLFTLMHWRRKWQPTPVFLPGESQGRGGLVGCRLWGGIESDTTEAT